MTNGVATSVWNSFLTGACSLGVLSQRERQSCPLGVGMIKVMYMGIVAVFWSSSHSHYILYIYIYYKYIYILNKIYLIYYICNIYIYILYTYTIFYIVYIIYIYIVSLCPSIRPSVPLSVSLSAVVEAGGP